MNSPHNSIQVFLPNTNTIQKPTNIVHNNAIVSPSGPNASTPISFLATMTMVPR